MANPCYLLPEEEIEAERRLDAPMALQLTSETSSLGFPLHKANSLKYNFIYHFCQGGFYLSRTGFNFWIFISPSSPKKRKARKVYCLKSFFYLQSLNYTILLNVKEKTSNESLAHLADLCALARTLSIYDIKIDFRMSALF